MSDILEKSALELASALKNREIKAVDLINAQFRQIDAVEDKVKSFISQSRESAVEMAERLDEKFDKGDALPPLAGIPIALKDNLCVKGGVTTCASKILENFTAPYTATAVQKVLDNGLIPVGKTNLDEFAMGSSTENSGFFPSRNPWDTSRAPGGSSGGSASAVSARQAILSLGSDTGGSIRQPAAFCGVVGMKPTYGRVSRYGLVAFASSLDQIGPFSKTVEESAHLLNVICGHDPLDSTSSTQPVPDFSEGLHQDIKGLKLGVPKELFGDDINDDIKQSVTQALDKLTEMGATWEECSFQSFKQAVATYYIIAPAEASANLARYDGVRFTSRSHGDTNLRKMYNTTRGECFGKEVKRRILIGTYALSSGYYDAYYLKAQKMRTLIKSDFDKAFQEYDALITPTTPTVAFKLGENADDPLAMYMADFATIPVNMAGLPGLSIPCGLSNGLPVGLQIITNSFDEATALRIGHQYQSQTGHHKAKPEL